MKALVSAACAREAGLSLRVEVEVLARGEHNPALITRAAVSKGSNSRQQQNTILIYRYVNIHGSLMQDAGCREEVGLNTGLMK